jgi:hypothetical protein
MHFTVVNASHIAAPQMSLSRGDLTRVLDTTPVAGEAARVRGEETDIPVPADISTRTVALESPAGGPSAAVRGRPMLVVP